MKKYKYIICADRIIFAIEVTAMASAIGFIICLFVTNGGIRNAENIAFRMFISILAVIAILGTVGWFLRRKIVEACHHVFGDEEISNTVYFDDDVSEEDIAEYMRANDERYAEAERHCK